MAWYGESGEAADVSLLVPPGLREKYTATGRIGPYETGSAPTLELVAVTDKDTGATFRYEAGRGTVTLDTTFEDSTAAVEASGRIWRDSNTILDWNRSRIGRPPGLTTIVNDEQLKVPILEMRHDRRRITQETLAWAGTFTLSELRGYLRVTHRRWRDFLDSF